ncbi:hypothetical protein TDB9533_04754 [Thalassocella blandensis]|nr:hypothetical protein TDB9533_04754 [Thalassocella blandensis]
MNFVIFVSNIEYFRKQRFSAIKGVKLFGSSEDLPLHFKVVGQDHDKYLDVDEQTYRPKRSGMDGVLVSKITNEGVWTVNEKLDMEMKNVFFVSNESDLDVTMQVYSFICENPCYPEDLLNCIKEQYVPIKISFDTVVVFGVACFQEKGSGKLYLLMNGGFSNLSGLLKIETLFEDLDAKTLSFEVEVEKN